MKELYTMVVEDFIQYNGKSALFLILVASLLFLWFTEGDRKFRTVFLYLVVALMAVFACPVYIWIAQRIDTEIYYRVLWTIPIGTLFCYSVVKLFRRMQKLLSKVLVCVMAVAIICLNGDFVYTKTIHMKSVNAYHMPDVVMHVADALSLELYHPHVVLPAELLPFIRQYSGTLFTPYGRNILEPQWSFSHTLFDAMEAEQYDIALVAQEAKKETCLFVVLSSIKAQLGSMEDYGYASVGFVDGYYIYMDVAIYQQVVEQKLLTQEELQRFEQLVTVKS